MSVLGALLALVAGYAVLHAVGQWRWRRMTDARLRRLDAARRPSDPACFDPAELADLPPPVARYFRVVLPPGTPIIRRVDVVHRGEFNLSPKGEFWRPFDSTQRVITARPGFLWNGRIRVMPGLQVAVHDAYVDGEGLLEPSLLGLVSLMRLHDRDELARGELMRFLAEAAWYPTALLPSQGVQWTALDDHRAMATLTDGPLSVSLEVGFDARGMIHTLRAEQRSRMVDGVAIPTAWEGRMSNYAVRDGLCVPLEGEVAWLLESGRQAYWRGHIQQIRYGH